MVLATDPLALRHLAALLAAAVVLMAAAPVAA